MRESRRVHFCKWARAFSCSFLVRIKLVGDSSSLKFRPVLVECECECECECAYEYECRYGCGFEIEFEFEFELADVCLYCESVPTTN